MADITLRDLVAEANETADDWTGGRHLDGKTTESLTMLRPLEFTPAMNVAPGLALSRLDISALLLGLGKQISFYANVCDEISTNGATLIGLFGRGLALAKILAVLEEADAKEAEEIDRDDIGETAPSKKMDS